MRFLARAFHAGLSSPPMRVLAMYALLALAFASAAVLSEIAGAALTNALVGSSRPFHRIFEILIAAALTAIIAARVMRAALPRLNCEADTKTRHIAALRFAATVCLGEAVLAGLDIGQDTSALYTGHGGIAHLLLLSSFASCTGVWIVWLLCSRCGAEPGPTRRTSPHIGVASAMLTLLVMTGLFVGTIKIEDHNRLAHLERNAELINLAGREGALAQRIGRLAILMERAQGSERNAYALSLEAATNDLDRQADLIRSLIASSALENDGGASGIVSRLDAASIHRERLTREARVLLGNPPPTERTAVMERLQLESEILLPFVEDAVAILQMYTEREIARSKQAAWNTLIALPGILAMMAIITVAPIVRIVRTQHSEVQAARDDAVKALADLEAYKAALDKYFIIAVTDRSGRITYANDLFCAQSKYSRDELIGQTHKILNSGRHDPEFFGRMWQSISSGGNWRGEICNKDKNGELYWVDTVIFPMIEADGRISRYISIRVDITERKRAEEALERANASLDAFVQHAPAAMAMFDNNMRYITHTRRWLQDYGLGEQSLVGQSHYAIFSYIPQEWRDRHARILAGAVERCEKQVLERAGKRNLVLSWEGRPWYHTDGTIGGMILLTEDITERKAAEAALRASEERLWQLANIDELTGLPNRMLFNQRLSAALSAADQTGATFAVGLIDVDKFKEVNDTYGHDAGDLLLKMVADRLSKALGPNDTLARLGGDEFAFIIHTEDATSDILPSVEALCAAPGELQVGTATLRCTLSVGVSRCPANGRVAGELLKNADIALYRAKALGRNRVELFVPEMRAAIDRTLRLRRDVDAALRTNSLSLAYQPIVSLADGSVAGFEALLRLHRNGCEHLTPSSFMEVFDDRAIAVAITDRVVDQALTQVREWLDAGVRFGKLAINVTAADFGPRRFAENFLDSLRRRSIAPGYICLEITEGMFLGHSSDKIGLGLCKLHQAGVEIAMDDFGTGFASLTDLKKFPLDRLKIDRSFVSEMTFDDNDASIVRAVIQLGHSLGMEVTAEGVEGYAQLAMLKALGCDHAQGFFVGEPMQAAMVPAWLKTLRPSAMRHVRRGYLSAS